MTSEQQSPLPKVNIIGTQLSLCDQEQLLRLIKEAIQNNERKLVLSGNIYSFNLAYENQWLQDFLNQADIVRLDGAGLGLGAKILGYSPPPRTTWADFAWDLAALAKEQAFTLYLLGAEPSVVDKAKNKLKARHLNLRIVGTHHGYFDKASDNPENKAVIAQINALKPNILIVGFGMPLQEKWLSENWHSLEANVTLTGGAVFDYISSELKRGPKWMTDNGFEWLARLLIEPKRLWWRYLIGNPLFFYRVLKQPFTHSLCRHPNETG